MSGPRSSRCARGNRRAFRSRLFFAASIEYVERYYAKGPRRRPVRIEFCEADILDAFDEWRRAVGVGGDAGRASDGGEERAGGRPRESLATHLDRVVARLVARRGGPDRSIDAALDEIVRELDAARVGEEPARRADALLDRLRELDRRLLEAARAASDDDTLRRVVAETDEQLSPFRGRMPADAYAQSQRACVERLLREHARLPTLTFD